jgi:hypothetical protein
VASGAWMPCPANAPAGATASYGKFGLLGDLTLSETLLLGQADDFVLSFAEAVENFLHDHGAQNLVDSSLWGGSSSS